MQPETQTPPSFMKWKELTSLVGSIRTRSLVARPTTIEQCREALAYCRQHGMTICARGAGRGYGDLALNNGHAIFDMSAMNRILNFDEKAAQITVESGTRLIDIYRAVHHRLLTLPASPTESHSSVAGAICANVNGKDAWRNGSFAHQVVRLTLLIANGETMTIDRSHELFNAVVGGIGLLGIIMDVTLQLRPIPSPFVEINRIPVPNTDALFKKMARIEKSHDAAVVWIDAYARGRKTGRSVIHAAKWIERHNTESQRREILKSGYKRLDEHRRFGLALHEKFSPILALMLQAQRPMMYSFNRLYYAMCRLMSLTGHSSNTELFLRFCFEASFTVPPAHLVCGPRGYTVQLTFPRSSARAAIIELLGICQSSPCPPVTTILRAHKPDDCLISFSEDGYSLNFEFHPKKRHEAASRKAVDRLIDATVRRGGKIHLAKDQVLTPEQFYRVFPRYRDLLVIKQRLDPDGLFTSDLARRVGIDPVLNKQ
ncbi:MAG: FAD-binding oxidoreductase [Thermodesulfobacteriota bacterium]|nr:FAD-binding oxidoreductase [Thermodesulfobacteriota bacterium]